MKTSLFDYELPPDRIAQESVTPRDHARLLVLDRSSGEFQDKHVYDLPDLLQEGDLLVFNDSKVFKARLRAGDKELFLLRPDEDRWIALARPGKKIHMGDVIELEDAYQTVRVTHKREDGTVVLDFGMSPDEVFALADRIGEVPVPPYVEPTEANRDSYQTVYAKERGSVAAPTAGFHFTEDLLKSLEQRGVEKTFVTLHVGLGTFRPMKSERLDEHRMHEEWGCVPPETAQRIKQAKAEGRRVVVVGTTAMRALESWAAEGLDARGWSGFTELFITPGYEFRVADGLMTNFHLPKSTLLVLVSAFADREKILNAYKHAIENEYRFYSFGDAMLIV